MGDAISRGIEGKVDLDEDFDNTKPTPQEILAINYERGSKVDAYQHSIYRHQRIDAGRALGYSTLRIIGHEVTRPLVRMASYLPFKRAA